MSSTNAEVRVDLSSMPRELEYGSDFPEPIYYNRETKQLCYRGFMTRASYDYLRSLSTHGDYQQALMELYQLSSEVIYQPHRSMIEPMLWIGTVLLTIMLVVTWWWFRN